MKAWVLELCELLSQMDVFLGGRCSDIDECTDGFFVDKKAEVAHWRKRAGKGKGRLAV